MDRDEEDEQDELPEEKAGEREIKYLTLKKKPIPKNKKREEEEEEQKITFHDGEPPAYHRVQLCLYPLEFSQKLDKQQT